MVILLSSGRTLIFERKGGGGSVLNSNKKRVFTNLRMIVNLLWEVVIYSEPWLAKDNSKSGEQSQDFMYKMFHFYSTYKLLAYLPKSTSSIRISNIFIIHSIGVFVISFSGEKRRGEAF